MRRISLDGVDYTEDSNVLDQFELVFELDETKSLNYSFSEGIIFFGKAFDYLEQVLVVNEDRLQAKVKAVLTLDCCNNKTYIFNIKVGSIDYRPGDCEIEAVLIRETPEAEAFRQLKSTIIWKDGFNKFLRVYYCEDPSTLQTVFFSAIYFLLLPILALLQFIENLFGGNVPSLDDVQGAISGCNGRYHTPPVIKDVLDYHLPRAGLVLESSIFNTPPYNSTFLLQAFDEGCKDCQTTDAARINLNVIQMLEEIAEVHNAEFRIVGDKLIYERRDFFEQTQLELVDMEIAYQEDYAENPANYQYIEDSLHAYTRIEFSNDSLDDSGNKVLPKYKDIIEHNPGGENEALSGEQSKIFSFGPVRGQEDVDSSRFINGFRESLGYTHEVILKRGVCSNIKPIIWDNNTPRQRAKMLYREIGGDRKEYNYPYFVNETEGIVPAFHAIDFPNEAKLNQWRVSDFEYLPADFCTSVDAVEQYGTDLGIKGKFGTGKSERITINFDRKTIKVEDVKF